MGRNGEKRPERGDYLTHKQIQALAALLTQPTKENVIEAIGRRLREADAELEGDAAA